jgi:hypothetical protein
MKKGLRPPQSMPVQAVLQALAQASKGAGGQDSRLPLRTSMSFSEVLSITYSGSRKNTPRTGPAAVTTAAPVAGASIAASLLLHPQF